MLGGESFSREPQGKAIGAPEPVQGKRVQRKPGRASLSMEDQSAALLKAEVIEYQPMPYGSNYVYLLAMKWNGAAFRAVYKPRQGEWPLWDFPDGTLYRRERAAYLVSQALGWGLVPPTVIRDGPYGTGMLQWFIDTRATDYIRLFRNHPADFKRTAAFDWLTNNADRKGGHCLEALDGRLWLIDHGLTFNVAPKLRTVIWDFAGQAIPEDVLADLESLFRHLNTHKSALVTALSELISPDELQALRERLALILAERAYTSTFGSHRRFPWPPY